MALLMKVADIQTNGTAILRTVAFVCQLRKHQYPVSIYENRQFIQQCNTHFGWQYERSCTCLRVPNCEAVPNPRWLVHGSCFALIYCVCFWGLSGKWYWGIIFSDRLFCSGCNFTLFIARVPSRTTNRLSVTHVAIFETVIRL